MDIQTRLREYTRAIKELRGQTVLCCNEGADRIDELEAENQRLENDLENECRLYEKNITHCVSERLRVDAENARLRAAVQDFLHNYENDVRHERQGQVVHMYIAHEGMMIKKMRAALEPNHE